MRALIQRNLKGKRILLLFIITNAIYLIMLIVTIPRVMRFAGGMKLLDMMPTGYSVAYVNTLFNALGEAGRDAYLFNQLPLDMLYPFLFGITNCLVLAFFLNKLGRLDGNWFYLCLLPLFSGLFDYGENAGIISMLMAYPDHSPFQAQLTNVFSVLKSFCTTLYFTVLIVCLVLFGINQFRKRNQL